MKRHLHSTCADEDNEGFVFNTEMVAEEEAKQRTLEWFMVCWMNGAGCIKGRI